MRVVIVILKPLVWAVCRLLFRIKFHGVDNIPAEGPCIIAPNHVTYFDPIWVTIPLRRRIYFMAWDKPFEIPGIGFLMRAFGAFPLNLETIDPSALREALDHLRRGHMLGLFPEGGRSKTGRVEQFKMGAFRLALTEGVPIVPVSVNGSQRIWPVERLLPRPGKLTITYHPPIRVDRVPDSLSKRELKRRSRIVAGETRKIIASGLDPAFAPVDHEEAEASAG